MMAWRSKSHLILFGVVLFFSLGAGSKPSGGSSASDFDKALTKFGVQAYLANLHAHHFMEYRPSRKSGLDKEFLGPGPCDVKGGFPQDDGRPCRNNEKGENVFMVPPKLSEARTEFFEDACEYARSQGGLDILFVTPHSKSGEGDGDADTQLKGYQDRQKLLGLINKPHEGHFLCGLGQEVSSISSGNHINVFGQMTQGAEQAKPLFFQAGDFRKFYSEVKDRRGKGEKILLQLNHPEVDRDLVWGPLKGGKKLKEALNDYGLDDFAPVGCILQKAKQAGQENQARAKKNSKKDSRKVAQAFEDCPADTPDQISMAALRETFAHIREASDDPFRLIEVVSPGGATSNPSTDFRPVHHRIEKSGQLTFEAIDEPDGIKDWIFYLSMGFKVGPAANQDNHHMNWGSATASRTGVLLKSLSEKDFLDGVDQRRSFASEDQNAKIFISAEQKHLMGDVFSTNKNKLKLQIGYQDPDEADKQATFKVFYYRSSEALPFGQGRGSPSVYRTLELDAETSKLQSGQVKTVDISLDDGEQYMFVEVQQYQDLDRLWSAPLWVTKH